MADVLLGGGSAPAFQVVRQAGSELWGSLHILIRGVHVCRVGGPGLLHPGAAFGGRRLQYEDSRDSQPLAQSPGRQSHPSDKQISRSIYSLQWSCKQKFSLQLHPPKQGAAELQVGTRNIPLTPSDLKQLRPSIKPAPASSVVLQPRFGLLIQSGCWEQFIHTEHNL